MMKKCIKCLKIKPLSDFYKVGDKRLTNKNEYHSYCKECKDAFHYDLCACGNRKNKQSKDCKDCHIRLNSRVGRVMKRTDGYLYEGVENHPYATKGGYVLQHRLVMERKLGRYLLPSETVHHKNGIRDDNDEDNLELKVGAHGQGITVKDAKTWAREILERYKDYE